MRFVLSSMVFFSALFTVLLTAACAPESEITPQLKAKMMAEILLDKPACHAFAERLKAPAIDVAAINKIYHDAVAVHCLKPTV